MKTKHGILYGFAVLLLAAVFTLTSCGGDDDNSVPPGDPDFAGLASAITSAETAKAAAGTSIKIASNGTVAADVAEGMKWVTQADVDALEAAITAAKAVKNNNASTKAQVDAAITALNAAVTTFTAAPKSGAKTTGFTQDEMTALITQANTLKDTAVVSADGKDVLTTTYWVTQTEQDALATAITTAATLNDTNYNALVAAVNVFETAKKRGEKAPLSGKAYFIYGEKIEFSTTAAGAVSGTYKAFSAKRVDGSGGDYALVDGKYDYQEIENGTYTWNAETVTTTPVQVAFASESGYGTPVDRAGYKLAVQNMINEYREEEGADAVQAQLASMGFATEAAYIEYATATAFANVTRSYAFSTDEKALFLDESLPANSGTNELATKTFHGLKWEGGTGGESSVDTSITYVFAAAGTYTYTVSTHTNISGTYAYDSPHKRVYLKPSTEGRAAYYQSALTQNWGDSSGYNSNEDSAAAQTNGQYRIDEYPYDLTAATVGWD
jgi:hypothetical protein